MADESVANKVTREAADKRTYYESEEAVATYSFYRFLDEEARLIPKYFKPGESVLDLGCGMGRTTLLLHEMGFQVRGVDLSEVFINTARKRFPYLDLRVGSFECLTEPTASFDHVLVGMNALDLAFPESARKKALSEFARVLKPGGTLIYSSHNIRSFHPLSPYYSRQLRWKLRNTVHTFRAAHYLHEEQEWVYYTTPANAIQQTEAAGLQLIEMLGFGRFRNARIDLYFSPYVHYVFRKPAHD